MNPEVPEKNSSAFGSDSALSAGGGAFLTTHWTVVLTAAQTDTTRADAALEKLCRTYWYPLYAFIRRRGYPPHEAQDLTQEFFARLLAKQYLKSVDRAKGKFRSFLLAAVEHFLANDWRRSQAQKRGGGLAFISLDEAAAEQQYLQVPDSGLTPEKLFEQQWATTLLEQVLTRLRQEFEAAGKGATFETLKIFLAREKADISYAELAAKLQTTEAAIKMSVSRLRQRYRELLQQEIASTVSSPQEIDEELRALYSALGG